jgi:hypothetical protein
MNDEANTYRTNNQTTTSTNDRTMAAAANSNSITPTLK